MRCEYIKKIKDVLDIMDEFDDPIDSYPLTGTIYIGCYEDDVIVSLMCYYNHLVHFFVRKEHRSKAFNYHKESQKLIPAGLLYCSIPEETVAFAEKAKYQHVGKINDRYIMRKENEP